VENWKFTERSSKS